MKLDRRNETSAKGMLIVHERYDRGVQYTSTFRLNLVLYDGALLNPKSLEVTVIQYFAVCFVVNLGHGIS